MERYDDRKSDFSIMLQNSGIISSGETREYVKRDVVKKKAF